MKTMKKVLCVLLVVLMCVTSAPLGGFVGLELPEWNWKASAVDEYKEGYYTYTVSNGEATITNVDNSIGGHLTIPSTLDDNIVTTIGDSAFYGCENLTSVTISDSIKIIGNCAFASCNQLTNILIIPDSVITIGDRAFEGCYNLTGIILGEHVKEIGDFAFADCEKITSVTIPDSVITIGHAAFYECLSVEDIIISDSVKTIEEQAFGNCFKLKNITVDEDNTSYSSDKNGVLFNKNKTVLIQYPIGISTTTYSIPNGVMTIGSYAFSDSKLVNITFPNTLSCIGDYSFESCDKIESITIPNSVTTIGEEAFAYSNILKTIIIPDSVTTIGSYAFQHCSSLISAEFGNKITTISEGLFENCTKLTSVTIGNSVTTIGEEAFEYCKSLTSIAIPTSVTNICGGAFSKCSNLAFVYFEGTEEQWKNINIDLYNEPLLNATIHFLGEDEPDEPKPDGYKLRLRSDGAYSDSIAIGNTIGFWTFLSNNGKSVDCERAYAISFDNPNIFDVVKTEITKPSFDVTLKAKKAGTTNMTISDNVTGAYVTIKLKANNVVDVLTMDEVYDLSTEEYGGITTYFYNINGLYINNYNYSKNDNDTFDVRMTAYNEKAHYGAVVSYDKNGNIHDFDIINPKDKLPENLWDGLYDSFDYVDYKLADWFSETNYTDVGWTQRTPINVEVPEDGYLKITNKYLNEIVFMTNVVDLTIDLAFAVNDLPEIGIEGVTEKTVKEILLKVGSTGLEKLCKKIFKEYSKGIGFENIYDVIFDVSDIAKEYEVDFFEIITENINYTELALDSVESAVLSIVAKPIKEVLDGFGYINTLIKCGDFFNSTLASEICIYTPPAEEKVRISNGVKVTSETPLDPDYVLHTYVINQNDDLMTDAVPTIDPLADNYNMYDITLYKSSQAVQPNAKIKVMIPIPAGYDKSRIAVYWYKEDGTLEKMNATVNGSYAIFETDHLSYYVLVEEHVHTYGEDGEICTDCGFDRTEGCGCNCHKTGIAGFFWKIINFFNKIFKLKQECKCGIKHY